jgi:DNA-binding response OmpR family regulator
MDNMHSYRVLIVEDDFDIAQNIADYLEELGHRVDFAQDGISGMHLALTLEFDVIILDVMLPGMDGLDFCSKLRKESDKSTPVLMLTARDTLEDKLAGFNAGADDYLVKPFALEELAARLEALARRRPGILDKNQLQVADLVLDKGRMVVTRSGKQIILNKVCFKILTLLMQASPNVVSRRDLEFALWGDMPPGSDALRSHIYALRKAVDKPFDILLLETVHGMGYRLVAPDDIPI